MPYPDVERLLVASLSGLLGVRVLTDTPSNLAQILPVVQVTRFGGTDAAPGLDRANVDLDVYAATRTQANALAERARYALLYVMPGTQMETATVNRVDTISGPALRPYDNPALRRVGASYQLTLHAKTIREVNP